VYFARESSVYFARPRELYVFRPPVRALYGSVYSRMDVSWRSLGGRERCGGEAEVVGVVKRSRAPGIGKFEICFK
jgi:hypothetical protein